MNNIDLNLEELTESEYKNINGGILPLIAFGLGFYIAYERAERANA